MRNERRAATAYALLLLAGTALVPAAAMAQIEEITVTATKTGATDLQKTPIAISAFSAAAIDKSLAYGVKDLVQMTPNVTLPQNGTFAMIYIRGVGTNNVFNGSDPSSTVHVDGVYYARPTQQFASFFDVERVEVLRGPQGTLYGRNSVGGTVNVISRVPTQEFQAKAQETIGNYGFTRTEGYVSGGLAPKVSASLSGYYAKHDAYRENIGTGPDLDDQNAGGARLQFRVELTDNFESITRADFNSRFEQVLGFGKPLYRYTPLTNTILGDYSKVATNAVTGNPGAMVRDYGVSQDFIYKLDNGLTLKSQTAYRHNLVKTRSDTDSSEIDTTVTNIREEQRQFSEELNLSGKLGALDFVAGLYYFNEHNASFNIVEARVPRTGSLLRPRVRTQAYAAYSQGTYHFNEQWSMTAGARYTKEIKGFENTTGTVPLANTAIFTAGPNRVSTEGRYYAFTPKAGLEFQATKDAMLFASVTRGFKSGGFNQTNISPTGGFAPETLWSYEAGVKTEWLNRRVRVNLTAFKYNYSNLQVQAFIRPGVTDITNASDAKVKGLELETIFEPAKGLLLTANLATLDAKYGQFLAAPGPGGITVNATGNRLNASPKYNANLSAEYNYDLQSGGLLFARGEYAWFDRQYFVASNDPQQSQGAYGVVNASLGYETPDGQWRFSIWGKNLTDKEYITVTGTVSSVVSGRPGEPRTFGARATWKM